MSRTVFTIVYAFMCLAPHFRFSCHCYFDVLGAAGNIVSGYTSKNIIIVSSAAFNIEFFYLTFAVRVVSRSSIPYKHYEGATY